MDSAFLDSVDDFIHCRVEILPFKYAGSLVGVIPSQITTWDPLLFSYLTGSILVNTCMLGGDFLTMCLMLSLFYSCIFLKFL